MGFTAVPGIQTYVFHNREHFALRSVAHAFRDTTRLQAVCSRVGVIDTHLLHSVPH